MTLLTTVMVRNRYVIMVIIYAQYRVGNNLSLAETENITLSMHVADKRERKFCIRHAVRHALIKKKKKND